MAWWVWPILLFFVSLLVGIVAVPAGVGGAVLFVPIVGSLFPFDLDFVRSTGLLIALTSSVSASPPLIRANMANLRLAMPPALMASIFSILGAMIGLALPGQVMQISFGAIILVIGILLFLAKNSEYPNVPVAGGLAKKLGIAGSYNEASTGEQIDWKAWRAGRGCLTFSFIGFIAGMFGIGAGWANVPVLNLLMGAPFKVAVASGIFVTSVAGTSAVWVYLGSGAVLPIIALPSILGMLIGARIGVQVLAKGRPRAIRMVVAGVLLLAGLRSLTRGLGILP
ncbi:MAG: sulfite exporter TauE/SafE family protein [Verrucomicrobia bacterium]|nr:sulfite exporter TauE/SafE family protein [Verrucomicrobiota bacterium]